MLGMGLEINLKSLEGVSDKLRAKVYSDAVKAAAIPAIAAVKAAVPVDTGATKKTIGVKHRKYRKGAIALAIIGARAGQARAVQRTFTKQGKQKIKLTRAMKGWKRAEVRDPAHTLHLAEKGRKAVTAKGDRFPIRLKGGQVVFGRRAKAAKGRFFMTKTFKRIANTSRTLMIESLRRGVAETMQHVRTVRSSLGIK